MNNQYDYNELLTEQDQIAQLISMISENQYELVIRTLLKRLTKIEEMIEHATSPYRQNLREILAEKMQPARTPTLNTQLRKL